MFVLNDSGVSTAADREASPSRATSSIRAGRLTCVIGIGGIGTLLSVGIGKGSDDRLVMVCRPEQVQVITRNGLHMSGLLGEVSLPPKRCETFESINSLPDGLVLDRILVCCKCHGVEQVAGELAQRRELVGPQTAVFTFQNGWGSHEPLLAVTDAVNIYHARVITGVHKTHPNCAVVTVHQDDILIGSLANASLEPAVTLARDLIAGGVPTRATPNLSSFLWAKLIYSACIALGAVYGRDIGTLASDPDIRLELECLLEETFWVVKRAGYVTGFGTFEAYREHFFGTLIPRTANHRSSMLQDLERDVALPRTEIDWICGSVVRLARDNGVLASLNEFVTERIHRLENHRRRAKGPQREESYCQKSEFKRVKEA